jgi:hypothetical protein
MSIEQTRTMAAVSRDIFEALCINSIEAFKIDRELWSVVPVGEGNFQSADDYRRKIVSAMAETAPGRQAFIDACSRTISEAEPLIEALKRRNGVSVLSPEEMKNAQSALREEIESGERFIASPPADFSPGHLEQFKSNLANQKVKLAVLDPARQVELKATGIGRYEKVLAEIAEKGESRRLGLLKDIYSLFLGIDGDKNGTVRGVAAEKAAIITLENRLIELKQIRAVAEKVPEVLSRTADIYEELQASHEQELINLKAKQEANSPVKGDGRKLNKNLVSENFLRVTPFVSRSMYESTLSDLEDGVPVFLDQMAIQIWGKPGIGKTAMIESVAQQLQILSRVYSAAQIDTSLFSGMPAVNRANSTLSLVLSEAVNECLFSPFIMVLDEFNRAADPALSNSMLRVAANFEVGGRRLFPGGVVVCINNPPDNSMNMRPMDAAAANRFRQIDVSDETMILNGWKTWAERSFRGKGKMEEVATQVVAFLTEFSQDFGNFLTAPTGDIVTPGQATYPTPRSWTRFIRQYGHQLEAGRVSRQSMETLGSEIVGSKSILEFSGFLEECEKLPSVPELLDRIARKGKADFFLSVEDAAYVMDSVFSHREATDKERQDMDGDPESGKGRKGKGKKQYSINVNFSCKEEAQKRRVEAAKTGKPVDLSKWPESDFLDRGIKSNDPHFKRLYGDFGVKAPERQKEIIKALQKLWGDVNLDNPAYQYIVQTRIVEALISHLRTSVKAHEPIQAQTMADLLKLVVTYPYDEGRNNMLQKIVYYMTATDTADGRALLKHMEKVGVAYPKLTKKPAPGAGDEPFEQSEVEYDIRKLKLENGVAPAGHLATMFSPIRTLVTLSYKVRDFFDDKPVQEVEVGR